MGRSKIDLAFECLQMSESSVSFKDLWAYVCEHTEMSKEEQDASISSFYTSLLLDGRFVTLGENNWDLRDRVTFDKVHIDMKDVYADTDTEDIDTEEEEEEKEYNEVFDENPEKSDDFKETEEDIDL